MSVTAREFNQITAANTSGRQPIVLVHGLWCLASSWRNWQAFLEDRGYAVVAVDWPGDAATVEAAREGGGSLAGISAGTVAAHVRDVVGQLDRKPILIGHSMGGLVVEIVAGAGVAAATIAIGPAQMKGIWTLPGTVLKALGPILADPRNLSRTVMLSESQFKYIFATTLDETEAAELYQDCVPAPAKPLFEVGTANLAPRGVTAVDTAQPERGPLLMFAGEKDTVTPYAIVEAAYKRQKRNPNPTEMVEIIGAGHSFVVDHNWSDLAERSIEFLARHGL
jgi:pimeloyl-ACP methyl ester carboxylesterase